MLVSLSVVMISLSISCKTQPNESKSSTDCLSNICDSLSKNSIRNNTLLAGALKASEIKDKLFSEYPMFTKEVQLNDSTKYFVIIVRQLVNNSK